MQHIQQQIQQLKAANQQLVARLEVRAAKQLGGWAVQLGSAMNMFQGLKCHLLLQATENVKSICTS